MKTSLYNINLHYTDKSYVFVFVNGIDYNEFLKTQQLEQLKQVLAIEADPTAQQYTPRSTKVVKIAQVGCNLLELFNLALGFTKTRYGKLNHNCRHFCDFVCENCCIRDQDP